jgi:hypothetical protein
MNAPAAPTYPKREDYHPNVLAFLPGCAGEELEHRSSLLLMRDRAMATKPACSEYGWEILDMVERIAREHAFRSMPLAELAEVRRLLIRLVSTASGFDALYAPQLPIGGVDVSVGA